ncbi:MAG: hypothetical protein IT536_19050 [Hyphomicrobiales bacterium]|nr:hypothetical protein [Hyphomicrobiales bacterium]
MMICRILLAIAIVGTTLHHAGAQFGGAPGMPGGGFGGPPAAPPPGCQQLLAVREELQKHGQAIEAANQKKAHVKTACQLFRNYIAAEAKMIKLLDAHGSACGVPAQVAQQVRGSHAKAQQIGKQVCDAAARGAMPAGPTLSDALGTSPTLPDISQKKGAGTFETLTGNPFARP